MEPRRLRSIGMDALLVSALVVLLVVAVAAGGRSSARLDAAPPAASARPADGPGEGEELQSREEWFYGQREFPRGSIPNGAYVRARAQQERVRRDTLGRASTPATPAETPTALTWSELGPHAISSYGSNYFSTFWGNNYEWFGTTPISGRITSLAPHPTDAATMYAGAATGGVWKTEDNGLTWESLFDTEAESIAVGAVAVDPADGETVYAGTGEANNSVDSYFGAGIFKSTDGGATWDPVGGTVANPDVFDNCYVADIVVKPGESSTVLAAVHDSGGVTTGCEQGVYRSLDGGDSWVRETSRCRPTDLVVDPVTPSIWYLGAMRKPGDAVECGVYKSTDSGDNFTASGSGLPTSGLGRVALAISPSTPSRLYAAITACPSGIDCVPATPRDDDLTKVGGLPKLWTTTTSGTSWSHIPAATDFCGAPQCNYDLALAVHPTTPATLYAGGMKLFKYVGGESAAPPAIGFCDSPCVLNASDIHVDFHALAFDKNGRLWIGSDGGVYRTSDGSTFTNLNADLRITQYYPGIDGAAAGPLTGGAQDNGGSSFRGSRGWSGIVGADGGFTAVSPTDPRRLYFTTQQLAIWKSTDGGKTVAYKVNGITLADPKLFITPLVMSATNDQRLFAGTMRLWKTTDAAENWGAISPVFGDTTDPFGNRISAIAEAPDEPQTIYIGTTFGEIRVTRNGGTTAAASWPDKSVAPFPTRYVTDIAVHDTAEGTAYATVSGFGTGHVWKTTNFGDSWAPFSGNLPDSPANAVVVDVRTTPNTVYVGTDVGVFWTTDGVTWVDANTNLPHTVVVDLLLDTDANELVAATHGRGMFTASLPPAPAPGGKILFVSDRDGDNDIYAVNANGTGVVNLTDNAAHDYDPAWSPDRSKIAFSTNRDGNYEIYVMNADGTGATRLTNATGTDEFPTWSGDGTQIAFDSSRDGDAEIFMVPAAGGAATQLTTNTSTDAYPSWSPTAATIAFHSNRDGNFEIYTMGAAGGAAARLTNNTAGDGEASWSPDGTRIAFDSSRDGDVEIYTMNADGTAQTAVTANAGTADEYPSWSPGGTHLVFDSDRDGDTNLFKIALAGGGAVRLTSSLDSDFDPAWQPAAGLPGSPTAVVANAGDGLADVTWAAAVSDGGSPITGYVVTPFIGPAAQTPIEVANVSTARVIGLTNGQTYTFRVAAKNAHGTGAQSDASNAVTPAGPPGAPTAVSATAGDAQATVAWTAPASTGGSPITGYVVTPSIGAVAQTPTVVGVTTSTSVTGLTNGQAYTFKVAATNAVGTGPQSAASNEVTPTGAVVPGTTVTSGPVGTYARSAATYTFTSDVPAAQFECRRNGGVWGVCVSPYTVSGLLPGREVLEFRAFTGTPGVETAVTPDPTPELRELRVVRPLVADWDADGKANVNVWRPASGGWLVQGSANAFFGRNGDVPVPAQWDADPDVDRAVWRPVSGGWYVEGSPTAYFGAAGDVPVPGQWDGDAELDKAVWRPVSGGWYVQGSAASFFGRSGDVPVPGDYDADPALDRAVFRPSNGGWFVEGSATVFHGQNGDVPVPADWNGDGKTDIAVFRPSSSTWFLRGISTTAFGAVGDVPLAGDFDADPAVDKVLFRPSNGAWYVDTGAAPFAFFGASSDIP
jgi:Tol biopolymer transport system component